MTRKIGQKHTRKLAMTWWCFGDGWRIGENGAFSLWMLPLDVKMDSAVLVFIRLKLPTSLYLHVVCYSCSCSCCLVFTWARVFFRKTKLVSKGINQSVPSSSEGPSHPYDAVATIVAPIQYFSPPQSVIHVYPWATGKKSIPWRRIKKNKYTQ